MSGIATGWALKHGPREKALKAVLVAVADCADRMGENAFPGVETLMQRTNYGRSSVFVALRRLVDDGWLSVTTQGGGRRRATGYRICMERVQPLDRFGQQTVQSTGLNGPIHGAHIRKNGRENARHPSRQCEDCGGSGWVPREGSDVFDRCPCESRLQVAR